MSETITIEQGSGNVFADLGYPNAEETLTKARLAQRITEVLAKKRLTQIQAAQLLGIDQPKVSKLLRGRLGVLHGTVVSFSDHPRPDVEIVIRRKPRSRRHARVSVIAA